MPAAAHPLPPTTPHPGDHRQPRLRVPSEPHPQVLRGHLKPPPDRRVVTFRVPSPSTPPRRAAWLSTPDSSAPGLPAPEPPRPKVCGFSGRTSEVPSVRLKPLGKGTGSRPLLLVKPADLISSKSLPGAVSRNGSRFEPWRLGEGTSGGEGGGGDKCQRSYPARCRCQETCIH